MQVSLHRSTSLPTTERIKLLNLTVLTNPSDSSLCFPFVFPWWLMISSNFTCSYCPFAYLLCVYSVLFFLFDFWIIENSLNILDIIPLSDTRISNISLHLWFAFLYSQCGVLMNRGFRFWSPICQYFLLWLCFCESFLRNLCWSQVHEDILILCILPGTL